MSARTIVESGMRPRETIRVTRRVTHMELPSVLLPLPFDGARFKYVGTAGWSLRVSFLK